MFRVSISTLLVMSFLTSVPLLAQDDEGRRGRRGNNWDPTEYLTQIDRDENGYVDSTELRGRMKEYIEGMGFDASKPIAIQSVLDKLQAGRDDKAQAEKRKAIDGRRQVSKFGTDTTLPSVPDFKSAAADAIQQQGNLEDLYDNNIVQMVQAYMRRYDQDKDGLLDSDESERIRRLLGDNADTDGNGKLGELEVAAALQKRQQGDNDNSGRRSRRSRSTTAAVPAANTKSYAFAPSTPSKSTSTPRVKSSRSLTGRQTAYVDGLFQKYDSNKDGSLDKEEREGMSKSVRLHDGDNDGSISRAEALESVLNPGGNKTASSSPSPDSNSRQGSRRGNPVQESTSGSGVANSTMNYDQSGFKTVPIVAPEGVVKVGSESNRSGNSDFAALDENGDGQISMREFREGGDWTDALVTRFQARDTNDDGLITADEFGK